MTAGEDMERRLHWLRLARELGQEDDFRALLDDVRREAMKEGGGQDTPHKLVCRRCNGYGLVPDFTNWDDYHGEPKPKPCPDCALPPLGFASRLAP